MALNELFDADAGLSINAKVIKSCTLEDPSSPSCFCEMCPSLMAIISGNAEVDIWGGAKLDNHALE